MNPVSLHQRFIERHTIHKELDPWDLELGGQLAKDILERIGVPLAVIRWNADAEQHDGSPGSLARANDLVEVAFHAARRKAPEAVIAAQLEDDQRRVEILEGPLNTGCATLGRFAADAGVNHAMFVPLALETCLQQCGPGLVNVYTESCTEAVAEYENSRRLGAVRIGGQQ